MTPNRKSTSPTNKNISISGDVRDSNVFIGDNNTFIQKFFNIFKSDSETLEHRNRRILLNHVENAWIKGVLDASLHGAALLDLGIKQDPEAVTQYPWAIKKESTDETLPAGLSMLEIFDSIGMGRSLLILGAPGSGKTTMLLELARGLIARAREDVTQPIPMVFNLASWTEKLSLADWLAQELNNLYSVPRKTAPDWVKGNKLLLLLDGLDEVRQESRAKCVETINDFRKQNGLTSLAVCSRSQDYADLNAKLSFEGAIEVQPLTQDQITEFFDRFGDEMAGIKQALEKDSTLREMAETPLFLSIMFMAYRDKRHVEILVSGDEKERRKRLFDTYIERMFERPRSKIERIEQQDIFHWLPWLARKMIDKKAVPYIFENMLPTWLPDNKQQRIYKLLYILLIGLLVGLIFGLIVGPFPGLLFGIIFGLSLGLSERKSFANDLKHWNWINLKKIIRTGLIVGLSTDLLYGLIVGVKVRLVFGLKAGLILGLGSGLIYGLLGGLIAGIIYVLNVSAHKEISTIDSVKWNWKDATKNLSVGLNVGMIYGLVFGIIYGWSIGIDRLIISYDRLGYKPIDWIVDGWFIGLVFGLGIGLSVVLMNYLIGGLNIQQVDQMTYPGQRLIFTIRNFLFYFLLFGLGTWLVAGLIITIGVMLVNNVLAIWHIPIEDSLIISRIFGLIAGLIGGLTYGGSAIIQHYVLRFILARNNLLPWRLVPFLDHCVDLIFLRRVGGGYIFVHRLLMEHFAEMYEKS